MRTSIYIVILARDSWWVDLDGAAHGPFHTRDAAVQRATALASDTARTGGRSEVRVMGANHVSELVYQSAKKGLLGRVAAAAHASA